MDIAQTKGTAILAFGFVGHFTAAVSRVQHPVDRAAGAALRLLDLTHVRVWCWPTPELRTMTFFCFFRSNDRTKMVVAHASFPFSSINSTDKNCSQIQKKRPCTLPASVACSSYLSSSKVKNKDRWTTGAIDRTVSVEQTEGASSRKA